MISHPLDQCNPVKLKTPANHPSGGTTMPLRAQGAQIAFSILFRRSPAITTCRVARPIPVSHQIITHGEHDLYFIRGTSCSSRRILLYRI